MGEKKLNPFMTRDDLLKHLGWSLSTYYKKAKLLEPALIKLVGKPLKPHRYDPDELAKLFGADGAKERQTDRKRRAMRSKIKERVLVPSVIDDSEELFD